MKKSVIEYKGAHCGKRRVIEMSERKVQNENECSLGRRSVIE